VDAIQSLARELDDMAAEIEARNAFDSAAG
jgi:hypothetical protein